MWIAERATVMTECSQRNASARADARRRRQRGQGLVELAFVLPVVAVLWMALIDLGRINVKKQQAFAALDAISMHIANQPTAKTEAELEDYGCDVLEQSGMFADMKKTKADCTGAVPKWVDVQPQIPDTTSSTGDKVYPVVVTVPVDAWLPFSIRLIDGTVFKNKANYSVTTGVHYVRSSLVGPQ